MSRKMKLPNVERAVVPGRKITHYLLSTTHRDGQHKAELFRSFGFQLETWEELATALLEHAREFEVVEIVPTPFGRNFVVEGALPAPDGRTPRQKSAPFGLLQKMRKRLHWPRPIHWMPENVSEKSNCAGIVAADILSAGEGGILPSGPTLDFPRFSNLSAGSAGLEAPALRQAGKPAATFFRHAL
ncbi:MAG: DUF6883 domain-containing protein, partial [Limisphaerales bacterium]